MRPGQWAGRSGAVVAGGGGLVTLLAFLAMPIAMVPFFGSITGVSLAGYASEVGQLAWLWLVPPIAVAVVALAARQYSVRPPPRAGAGARSASRYWLG
ncbi:MAG: hypothetical protein ACRDTT_21020 [Pseudonocardiaceae bacterium]